MSLLWESDDEDSEFDSPRVIIRNPRVNVRNNGAGSASSTNPVVFAPISNDLLGIWRQLPEQIRLDPSLASIQEYDRIIPNIDNLHHTNSTPVDHLIVNMSLSAQPSSSNNQFCRATSPSVGENNFHIHVNNENENVTKPCYRYVKLILLTCCWAIFTIILMTHSEKSAAIHQVAVASCQARNYVIGQFTGKQISLEVEGPLRSTDSSKDDLSPYHLIVWLQITGNYTKNVTEPWIISLPSADAIDNVQSEKRQKIFALNNFNSTIITNESVSVNLITNSPMSFPVTIVYSHMPINGDTAIIYATVILIGLYVMIIFEIVHRTLAAMLASTMALAVLATMDQRPSMTELVSWIDIDTILLLFSMMILVAIFAETGIFDYLAVYAYKITGGKTWPLINTLCFFTIILSSFLDNVTMILLMTPVTIRLCEVMEINPVPILTTMLIYSNIGGALTPVGDPPNVIIASNRDVINAGIGFGSFVLHMLIGVLIAIVVTYTYFRLLFRDISVLRFDEPQEVQELRHEIAIWQRAAESLSSYSKDENMVRATLKKKVHKLLNQLEVKKLTTSVALEKYKTTLEELQERYPIRDKWLMIKCTIVLIFVITLFFLHNLPNLHLSLGWSALTGVLLLLILADSKDLEGILARVEWSTLIFFAALFILMEELSQMGLIDWIGKQTEWIILSTEQDSRLAVAILLILWVSAIASALVDNVPLVTMMVRIAVNLSKNDELELPLQPLIWALVFGACMGGNATLIGATANVICAGVAEQHGYRFTFIQFLKVGFPIMIATVATSSIYLIIAHVVFEWH